MTDSSKSSSDQLLTSNAEALSVNPKSKSENIFCAENDVEVQDDLFGVPVGFTFIFLLRST